MHDILGHGHGHENPQMPQSNDVRLALLERDSIELKANYDRLAQKLDGVKDKLDEERIARVKIGAIVTVFSVSAGYVWGKWHEFVALFGNGKIP